MVLAWRDAICHLSVKWQFQYNDTPAEKTAVYQSVSAHVQKSRDPTPGSGAYFIGIHPVTLYVALMSLRVCRTEGDVYESDHGNSYFGAENYQWLLAVKQK